MAGRLVGRPGAPTPWPENPEDQQQAEEELLQRLVDLNHQRATEEARGNIRWLRPDYQAPEAIAQQGKLDTTTEADDEETAATPAPQTKCPCAKTL